MDHQWRPRPIQGNVCPTCSVSHFPFCPPPLPFHQPSRFPFEAGHAFQRPAIPFTPYAGPAGTHGSYVANRNDGFADPTLLHRNPNWQLTSQYPRDSFRPPLYEHGAPNGEGDRNFKRPRVDDSGSATSANYFDNNPDRNLSEDERRLKLIRDHGVALSKPPEEQTFGGPGKLNQNGFHSDENEVFSRSQIGGFSSFQYGQPRTSQQMFQRPANDSAAVNRLGYSGRDSWQGVSAPYSEQAGNGDPNKLQHDVQVRQDFHSAAQSSNGSLPAHEFSFRSQEGRGVYGPYSHPTSNRNFSENMGLMGASRIFNGQPPLPSSPPPPLPLDPPTNQSSELTYFSPPKAPASLFPVSARSSPLAPSSYTKVPEAHSLPQPYFQNKSLPQSSAGFSLQVCLLVYCWHFKFETLLFSIKHLFLL